MTFPSVFTNPCGGYNVYYAEVSSPQQAFTLIHYNYIPTNFLIPNVNPAKTYIVQIYAVDCEGNEQLCVSQTVSYDEPPCTPAILNSITFTLIRGVYTLTFNVTQSIPATNIFYIHYNQCNFIGGGGTGVPDTGNITKNSTNSNPEIFTVQVNPNLNTGSGGLTYCGTITDGCNFSRNFDVSLTD